ncbi:SAM-dependent methyltransferase [Actinomadura parmotrematis]|uniref:SAM-dependent methyltransferase n=1 Tax=Actinomadura parmotrematis TaxID=2864039 RepID=A0ABS7FQM6_9ACTN|nr:SAM-dependent methyltransferase [Actinomadura parmotrematis]MBW8482705.1 SAM-dependent methyltransferase [Actinomadura parmotrematis]
MTARPLPGIDTARPSAARVYDYLLGGKDNYEVDRRAADAVLQGSPQAREAAVENRAFLGRIVRHLVEHEGVRQFIDLGAGLPTADNTHQIAQRLDPGARVLYADHDPIVLAHARALLADQPGTAYVQADVRDADAVLAAPETRDVIDFDRPVAVLAIAVLHFVRDGEDPAGLVRRYAAALPAGGFIALSHVTSEGMDPEVRARIHATYDDAPSPLQVRSREQITALFGDLELRPPGVVPVREWPRPGYGEPLPLTLLGGLARVAPPAAQPVTPPAG